jgi:putative OPT family oligopeptide transporter
LGAVSKGCESPTVPAEVSLPEITLKAVILSVVLAAVLAAANAYLGLFAGMTVSASIPAAVASMAVLRLFQRSNILENNIVQTAASSGEAVAAGVIFTIPALLLIGYWTSFDYMQTAAISLIGGILGVLFTIPLRRALIVEARLRYPEGVATAAVLKVGSAVSGVSPARASRGIRLLLTAAVLGAAVKFAESGLRLWTEALEGAARVGQALLYGGINLSPALIAVGFIIGADTAVVVFLGGVLAAWVLTPAMALLTDVPDGVPALNAARSLWSGHVRYVGIGAMIVGGLWTLLHLRRTILDGLRRSMGLRIPMLDGAPNQSQSVVPRTERDVPLPWIVVSFLLTLIPMALIYRRAVGGVPTALMMTCIMAIAGFLFAAVAGYMAGVVGSSSNPVSGVTIATIAFSAAILVLVMGPGNPAGPAAALMIGAVVCCAAAMAGDNLQDLKTGHMVGATPWKQQIMQVVGVATAAVVIVPVLTVLQAKYGFGESSALHPHPLAAPQATLMASLAKGVFGGDLPWDLVGLGAVVAVLVIAIDQRLHRAGKGFRIHVLAFALGLYLPLKLSAAILAGGVIQALAHKYKQADIEGGNHAGILCAAGLVTGEALMGIAIAIPVALSGMWPSLSADPFVLFATPPAGGWPGLVVLVMVSLWLYHCSTGTSQAT